MEITCLIVEDEPLARRGLENHVKKTSRLILLGSFGNGQEAIEFLKENHVDLLISDIAMPEMDGLSMLRNLPIPPVAILISAHPEFACEAYDLDVVDYINKPYIYERFLKGINKAMNIIELTRSKKLRHHYMHIKDREKTLLVNYSDIHYIQGVGDYLNIKTNERICMTSLSLKEIEKQLPSHFIRVHKSFIVNAHFIAGVAFREIEMKYSDHTIPIGRTYRTELFNRLGIK